jgi:hypothetical protein
LTENKKPRSWGHMSDASDRQSRFVSACIACTHHSRPVTARGSQSDVSDTRPPRTQVRCRCFYIVDPPSESITAVNEPTRKRRLSPAHREQTHVMSCVWVPVGKHTWSIFHDDEAFEKCYPRPQNHIGHWSLSHTGKNINLHDRQTRQLRRPPSQPG